MTAAWRTGQKVWLQNNSAPLLRAALTNSLFKISEDGLKALVLEETEVRRRQIALASASWRVKRC